MDKIDIELPPLPEGFYPSVNPNNNDERVYDADDMREYALAALAVAKAAAPAPAAQSAGQELIYQARVYGGWNDVSRSEFEQIDANERPKRIVYAAPVNASVPVGETALRSRWNRIANSEDMFEQFVAEVRALIAAPVNGGTHGLWDVYAFGKWQRRVSAPVVWDAHTVYLDMVKNGWSKDIELRGVSSANYSAPVNGGEREHLNVLLERCAERLEEYGMRDCGRSVRGMKIPNDGSPVERAADAQQVGGDISHRWKCTNCKNEFWHIGEKRPNCPTCKAWDQYTFPLACKGKNCTATDGVSHSPECIAEHDAALTSPAKVGGQPVEGLGRMTAEDEGIVTLQFVSEGSAQAFMCNFSPSVDVDAMPDIAANQAKGGCVVTGGVKLRLPFPPSLNRIWRAVAGRIVLSKLARQWINDAPAHLPRGRVVPLTGRLRVDMTLCAPQSLRGKAWDIMNREKLLCDLLTKQRVWLDDSQVDSFHIERGDYDETGRGYVDILITLI